MFHFGGFPHVKFTRFSWWFALFPEYLLLCSFLCFTIHWLLQHFCGAGWQLKGLRGDGWTNCHHWCSCDQRHLPDIALVPSEIKQCRVQFSNVVFRRSFCSPPSFIIRPQTVENVKGPVFKHLIYCRVLPMPKRLGREYIHVSKACFRLSKELD